MDAEHSGVCPACGGPAQPLGVLGGRLHSRCRNCGMDSSHRLDNDLDAFLNQTSQDTE